MRAKGIDGEVADDLNEGIRLTSPQLIYIPEPEEIRLRVVYGPGRAMIPPPDEEPITVSVGGYMLQ